MNKKTVLKAIKGSGGIISSIARSLNCDWHTAKKYVNKWEEAIQAFEDETETILDMAEGTVYKNIKDGNSQDAKWLLATRGKNRGYSEKHEIEHTGEIKATHFVIEGNEQD